MTSQPHDPIPGIFNYCDRWCERCTMTARCGLFAIEQDLSERKARGEEEGRAFWEAMNTVYGRELWFPAEVDPCSRALLTHSHSSFL